MKIILYLTEVRDRSLRLKPTEKRMREIFPLSFYFEADMAAILVIEDDLTFSRILEGFLQKQGFKVSVSHKGLEGLKLFLAHPADLVLLDYRLPDTSGLENLTEIKKSSPGTPVIIMTSFSDIRTAVKAMQVGAFEYITKPVNPDELLMIVQQATCLYL